MPRGGTRRGGVRRRLGCHHPGGAAPDAPGLGHRGVGLTRYVVATAEGAAVVELAAPAGALRALVLLGHGAGGGIDSPDLAELAAALPAAGFAVARVEQPYRAAGRRTPPAARRLDAAWLTVVAELLGGDRLSGLPLVVGGRSSGARVACRTAAAAGAAAVVALAFPLRPPGRSTSRLDELLGVPVATLVVQGSRDCFGGPTDFPAPLPPQFGLLAISGADHGFRTRRVDGRSTGECLAELSRGVLGWLDRRFPVSPPAPG